ncbi:hypothetical protein BDN72DRAFT_840346 [Pluteus cervinus]|uniref:Uncharacterized protein n=1 Tax=Pluteus cervinus TaxID=181527 RepID=A0ACD3AVW6_9AGAR|nr:hypothetical protein BDN72DRAFT_840346 [Pluteus cervinus]
MPDQPELPPEIEEIIFSLAVQDDWTSAKSLILVAKRVHHWLIPQIYKVAIFHESRPERPTPKFDSRSLITHGKHVRHAMFHNGTTRLTLLHNRPGECLAWCPNAIDVALWISDECYDKVLIEQLLRLPLMRLSLNLGCLQNTVRQYPEISAPIHFPSVTQLELINPGNLISPHQLKEMFPALTHLALNASGHNLISMTKDVLTLWKDQLKVLLWYRGESASEYPTLAYPEDDNPLPSDDPRLVVIRYGRGYVGSWYEGTRGGLSIWRVAEEAITRPEEVSRDSSN